VHVLHEAVYDVQGVCGRVYVQAGGGEGLCGGVLVPGDGVVEVQEHVLELVPGLYGSEVGGLEVLGGVLAAHGAGQVCADGLYDGEELFAVFVEVSVVYLLCEGVQQGPNGRSPGELCVGVPGLRLGLCLCLGLCLGLLRLRQWRGGGVCVSEVHVHGHKPVVCVCVLSKHRCNYIIRVFFLSFLSFPFLSFPFLFFLFFFFSFFLFFFFSFSFLFFSFFSFFLFFFFSFFLLPRCARIGHGTHSFFF
jgi:hypothetical protein